MDRNSTWKRQLWGGLAVAFLVCVATRMVLAQRVVADGTVVFSELQYHPQDDLAPEWVELQSQQAVDTDLTGWSIAGGIDFAFPVGTILPGGGYLVVASDPAALANVPGIEDILGPFARRLANGGERLVLRNNNGRSMSFVDYNDEVPWPIGPDGSGYTLAKVRRLATSGPAANWAWSAEPGGTPGRANFPDGALPEGTVVFSEVAPGEAAAFFVELTNVSEAAVALDGMVLAVRDGGEFVLPQEILAPGAYRSFSAQEMAVPAPAAGTPLFLYSASRDSLVDALRVEAGLRGRLPDHASPTLGGAQHWFTPQSSTPGAVNRFAFEDDIVIHEIQYHSRPSHHVPEVSDRILTETLVARDSVWRYNETGADLGPNWHQDAHAVDGSEWLAGAGAFGFEDGKLEYPITTEITDPFTVKPFVVTYYFEVDFEVDAPRPLSFRHQIDDGAVFYLNGAEVHRFNMPEGDVAADTLAVERILTAPVSEPVIIPASLVLAGSNRLSVEVHQQKVRNRDLVFGLELVVEVGVVPGLPEVPFQDGREEWIELYHKGETPVDLSGWTLAGGVAFAFPPGTLLGPGEYLLVAEDSAALAAQYPTARILGDFSGRLADASDTIRLLDASRNPADEVTYFEDGRWPRFADGRGSTLELRDPRADNSKGEAWAASDESLRSTWHEYSIHQRAETALRHAPEHAALEFGLLHAPGEFLIDDVTVVESPGGDSETTLLSAGFDSGTATGWFLSGNHQRSEVIMDPQAGNFVLHVKASGTHHAPVNPAGGTDGNRIFTRLTRDVVEGKEYELRFRARWLGGGRLLSTRLSFTRVAETTILQVPPGSGTPGAANTVASGNAGPTYDKLRCVPTVPAANEIMTVSVEAADPGQIASMVLWYRTSGAWESTPMGVAGMGVFSGTIPGQAAASVVQFYVEGADLEGATSTFPQPGASSHAFIKVDDGAADRSGLRNNFRIIMTAADRDHLFNPANRRSNERLGATVVYGETSEESEVFYGAGVRLKGFVSRSNEGRGFSIRFASDQLFRGVHKRVDMDRNGMRESVIKHIANHAGGIPSMYDDVVYLVGPRSQENGPAQARMAGFEDIYLDGQFENGAEGTVYEYEVITFADDTKNDIQDYGSDREDYRWTYLIKNNRARDEYKDLIAFAREFGPEDGELDPEALAQVMDIDQWMRVFAYQSLMSVSDAYSRSGHHNLKLYVRPSDRRVLAMPWDWDNHFARGFNSWVTGESTANVKRIIELPAHLRVFYGHIQDIIATTYNLEYMERWLAHYGDLLGEEYTGATSFIRGRSNFLLSRISVVEFRLLTNDGADLTIDATHVVIEGRGGSEVREIRLAGEEDPFEVTWFTASGVERSGKPADSWRVTVPLEKGANALQFEGVGFGGDIVATAAITVTSTVDVPPHRGALRVTEVMYHPPSGNLDQDKYEFIELENIGAVPLDLTGVRFREGIHYTFDAIVLGPREQIVVVADFDAFFERYGESAALVAGPFDGQLANRGESLRLDDPDGRTILQFAYDDAWHPSTDGHGPSLEIVNAKAPSATWGNAGAWRPSAEFGGTPAGGGVGVGGKQLPGDYSQDGVLGIGDPIALLQALFGGAAPLPPCSGESVNAEGDALLFDANGDSRVDGSDPVQVLNFLFLGGPPHALGRSCTAIVGCPMACRA